MNKTSTRSNPSQSPAAGTLPRTGSTTRRASLRRGAGIASGVCAGLFIAWLPLGIVGAVPFVLQIPGESLLRTHAGAAVACLMVTAWACWED